MHSEPSTASPVSDVPAAMLPGAPVPAAVRPVEVIAEVGVNHDGSLERALKLVDVARECGAGAVKFQTFRASRLAAPGAALASYQRERGAATTQRDMLRSLELSEADFRRIAAHCERVGIEFISTPFDGDSAAFLCGLGVRRFKIGSGDLTNTPLLERIGRFRLPVILSTGMADDDEIDEALEVLDTSGAGSVTLLHCVSRYPTPPEDLCLLRMPHLRRRFGRAVGLSDHTLGTEAALLACALGAVCIEKHLTLSRQSPGPDHAASADPPTLARLTRQLRVAESMLGDAQRCHHPEEVETRDLVRKSIVAVRDVTPGEVLDEASIAVLRPGTGIPPREWKHIVGRRAARPIASGEPLQWNQVL